MTEPGNGRRPGPLPFAAILVLVAMLSAFLWFRLGREERAPAVVKPPPAVASIVEVAEADPEPQPEPEPEPPAPAPADTPEVQEDIEEPAVGEAPEPSVAVAVVQEEPPAPAPQDGFDEKLAEIRKALDEKRWDDAEAAIRAAAKIRADEKTLLPLAKELAAGRTVEMQEKRKKWEAAWQEARDKARAAQGEAEWEKAIAILTTFAAAHPEAKEEPAYQGMLRKLRTYLDDAEQGYRTHMDLARKHLEAGKHAEAIAEARKAVVNHPARKGEAEKIQEEARNKMSLSGMVRIPSVNCWIGSDAPDEGGRRRVKLKPFLIDKHEVTCREYQAFLIATNREGPPNWSGPNRRTPPMGRGEILWDHPVVLVTHADAEAYAKWAGKRLPTAEEWEVAARGPDGRTWPWGDTFLKDGKEYYANTLEYWRDARRQNQFPTTLPRTEFADANSASPFGVHGMSGNVWEWTSTVKKIDVAGSTIEGRVLKGGSFMTPSKAARCSNIQVEDPALTHWDIGFRCARDVK